MRPDAVSRTGLPLFAAAGFAVALLWGAIAFALLAAKREAVTRADAQGHILARSLAEHEAASLRAIDLVLLHLRAEWRENLAPFDTHVAREQENLRHEHVARVVVVGADGRIAYSSLPGLRGVDVSNQPYFKAHKESGRPDLQISAPALDPVLKQWTIEFTRALPDAQGRFAGVIALFVPPPGLEQIYDDIQLGAGRVIALVRADGQIVASSHDLARVSKVSLADSPALGPDAAPEGGFRRRAKTDGVERLYRYQKVPGYPLTVFVGQALDTVLAPYRAQRAIYVAAGVLTTILLLTVAQLLNSRRRHLLVAEQGRARLEADLRRSEARLRLIAETIDEVVWSADIKTEKNFYISPAYERLWERSRQSLMENPNSFADAIHPQDRERVLTGVEAAKRDGLPFDFEYRIVLPDGALRWIWDRGYPVHTESGAATRYVGAAQDISKRKQAEQALQEKIAHLQLVYDTSSVAIFEVDAQGVITHANRRMAEMFGVPLQHLIGSAYLDYVRADERDAASQSMFALLQSKVDELDRERRYLRTDRSEFWGRITGRRMTDAGGRVTGLVGVLADITEARRA